MNQVAAPKAVEHPTCDCGRRSLLVVGATIYPARQDLARRMFYMCIKCQAWVGCHPGTLRPLGRLANAELRAAKQRVHAILDPLWKVAEKRGRARRHCYKRLAADLGIKPEDCHVGMFDTPTCERAIAAIGAWGHSIETHVADWPRDANGSPVP